MVKRIEWLRNQIDSQEKIKNQFLREGNEIGVARCNKKIQEFKKELIRLI